MSAARCPRTWEAEAARDGRSSPEANASFALHAQRCPDCARETRALAALGLQLRAAARPPADELTLRRVRQELLAEANRRTLAPHSAAGWISRLGTARARGVLAVVVVSVALLGYRMRGAKGPEPVALRLVAAAGARFDHSRAGQLEVVDLREGSLEISFDRSSHRSLLVRVPDGEIRDLGTVFLVRVHAGRTEQITVREGAVLLRRAGWEDVVLAAGETYSAPDLAAPSASRTAERGAASAAVSSKAAKAEAGPTPSGADIVGSSAGGPVGAAAGRPIRQPSAAGVARGHAAQTSSAAATPMDRPELRAATPNERARAGGAGTRGRGRANGVAASVVDRQDRAYLHILALLQDGRRAEARLAAREYQHDFPDGFRGSEVARIADGDAP
jgi:ferric-dicitrate binding protein FerR (iron transport regulator)